MDDNKSSNNEYGSYFQEANDELEKVFSSYNPSNNNGTPSYIPVQPSTYIVSSSGQNSGNSTSKTNTGRVRPNGYNRTHNPNVGRARTTNIPRKNNYRRPSNLTPPRNTSKSENRNENEDSESRVSQTRRKAEDTTEKVIKIKKTITFLSKYKFIIIGCLIAFVIVMLFMFLMMVVELDGDNNDGDATSTTTYDEITMNTNGSGNEELWWPIGSSEVTTSIDIDGNTIEFRSGVPVSTWISSGYKTPERPKHAALDITAGGDVYLIAMADGVVTYVKCGTKEKPCTRDTGYNTYGGNSNACTSEGEVSIAIKYNNGYESKYLHLENSSIPEFLKDGSKVYQGQVVGKMGNTGCSDGQHLHLALLVNNQAVNPENFVTSSSPRSLPDGVTKRSEDILKDSVFGENLEGKDNKQTICLTLKNYGYSDTAVAGIMVNMWHESNSFNPNEVNEIGCVGVFQWCDHYDRQKNLKRLYPNNEWKKLNNQLEFFQIEMKDNYYKPSRDALANDSLSVSEKTYKFCMNFEVPGESLCIDRKNSKLNNEYYNYVKNGCK